MKKMFIVIGIFLILYLVLRIGYRFYGTGHHYEYTVSDEDKSIVVSETFRNIKNNPYYYFEINIGDDKFYYQTYHNFKNRSKIIENVYYYVSENYKCILPVFVDNQIISDILCKSSNNYLYFYHNLKGVNSELDSFANSLSSYGYDSQNWVDSEQESEVDGLTLYYANMPSNHYFMLTNYKGVLLFNNKSKKVNKINLFTTDVYQKKLDFVYQNKYVVADYNAKFRFHEFYVIDTLTGEKSTIVSSDELSLDSYIQGMVANKIYFFDKDSKKQYEIDMDSYQIKEVGNEKLGIKIYDSATEQWEIVSAITASNEVLTFKEQNMALDEEFTKVEHIGTDEYGYYFYYKKVDDKYLVYRSNVQNKEQLTYIFTTSNIHNIVYFYDSVYFINDEYINKYSDAEGIRKIMGYSELKFNENIYFSVYSK